MDAGKTDQYRKIYFECAPMLLRFAEKFVSCFYAEDIVHDVFLKLWSKQIFLLPEVEVKRILFVAVRYACIDQIRKLNQEQEYIDKRIIQLKLEELDFYEAADELFMKKDLLGILLQKIEELPERNREIFKMSYLREMKAAEIAAYLKISVRTVENQLYRALVFLRKTTSHLFVVSTFLISFVI